MDENQDFASEWQQGKGSASGKMTLTRIQHQ